MQDDGKSHAIETEIPHRQFRRPSRELIAVSQIAATICIAANAGNLYKLVAIFAWSFAIVCFNRNGARNFGKLCSTKAKCLKHFGLWHAPCDVMIPGKHRAGHGTSGKSQHNDLSSHGVRPVKSLISTVALALLAISSLATSSASAQEVVAVLDVAEVFKVNQSFDSQMKNLKQEAEGLKTEIQQRQESIKQKAQSIAQSGYEPGSPKRNEMEGAVEQEQAGLRTWARQQEARLLTTEAKVYYDTYKKMQRVVSELASVNKISMVIRYDGGKIDPSSRPEVIKAVNRSVVYSDKNIDLTPYVIEGMGPRVAEKTGPAIK